MAAITIHSLTHSGAAMQLCQYYGKLREGAILKVYEKEEKKMAPVKGFYKHTEETKAKMREARKNRGLHSKETKAKMRATSLRRWQDEDYRTVHIKAMRKFRETHPTNPHTTEMNNRNWQDEDYQDRMFEVQSRKKTSFMRENARLGRNGVLSGPCWWLTFRDFVKSACYMNQTRYYIASITIRQILLDKGVNRQDVVLFLNWSIGHTQEELEDHFHLGKNQARKRILKLEGIFPGVMQDGVSIEAFPTQTIEKWFKIKQKW